MLFAVAVAATPDRRPLPPSFEKFAEIFDPALGRLGLRVARANLEDAPKYRVDPNGDHLAVYVEPIGDSTAADYLDNIGPLAAIFLPQVFERWKGLRSFDVCQEPLPSVDASPEPPSVTQLVVTRRGAAQIRWRDITLTDLVALQDPRHGPRRLKTRDFSLYVNEELQAEPAYERAVDARP